MYVAMKRQGGGRWLCKLVILTAAIYWFMSDGLQTSVFQQMTISADTAKDSPFSKALLLLLLAYLGFCAIRGIYRRKVRRPKSDGFKKYQKLRE